jgi:hypothetical protein
VEAAGLLDVTRDGSVGAYHALELAQQLRRHGATPGAGS